IERLPSNVLSVGSNYNNLIHLSQLANHDSFEDLIEQREVYCRYGGNYSQHTNISDLQNKVDPHRTYQQRKVEIESKAEQNKNNTLRQVRDLRPKIATLRTAKLNELLRLNSERGQELFEALGKNAELARFLILEGHLDDTYYQYTSLFHSGRMSPNDNKYLIKIRAFITPEPDFPIDNPHEVIAAMRDEDFEQSYILNISLVDGLLSDQS
ncbi:DNA-binding protein, partial [Vibrio parahaemolyticus]